MDDASARPVASQGSPEDEMLAAHVAPEGSGASPDAVGQSAPHIDPVTGDLVVDDGRSASAIPQEELDRLTDAMIAALKTVYDPEIPVDIYELGLIYKVDISDDRDVLVDMTLTAPGCPVAGDMPGWVQTAILSVEGVKSCHVDLTFDPPWDPSKMSDEAKLQLNMF